MEQFTTRRDEIQPDRMQYAKQEIEKLGYKIIYQDRAEIRFVFKGATIKFFPYKGWASGRTINDGRGIRNLLPQIKDARRLVLMAIWGKHFFEVCEHMDANGFVDPGLGFSPEVWGYTSNPDEHEVNWNENGHWQPNLKLNE